MPIDTKELLHRLSKATDVKEFIDENEKEFHNRSCTDFLNEILVQKKTSVSEVARNSGQGEYVYKVMRGERKASRDVLISIAVGLCLSLDETQHLLRISKWAILDPRDKRDSIIIYSINEKHTINQLNDLLYDMEQGIL